MKNIVADVSQYIGGEGVSVLNTKKELQAFYLTHLKRHKTWKAIASIEDWLPVDRDFLQQFRLDLDANSVDTKVILRDGGQKYEPNDLTHRKVKVVGDKYTFRSSIDILDNVMLIMNPELSVLGIVIENPLLLDVFNDTFDLLWDALPDNHNT